MPVASGRIGILTLVAVVAILAAGCASDPCKSTSGAASCAAILKFRHRTYLGTGVHIHSRNGRRGIAPKARLRKIGVAVQPVCADTNCSGSADVPQRFDVARIDGVSPTTTIVTLRWGIIYVRSGVAADRGSLKQLIQPKGRTPRG